ncbi:TetR/AcrR family transcriptional regulator [Paenibacillus sp. TAF43_2]|uniref:TetR/AcrR family transcriptional regulator n=1 Tax=Paenibacillus sp. TAF43_2 TaxID=3233069 RepID=UPI003F9D186E
MNDKLDRRQIRTKQLLYEALMSLIEEKGADTVTVTDVANRANVNRGTFYLHYCDVPDMLQQLKDEVFATIEACVMKFDIMEARTYLDKDEPYPQSIKIFEELARHADFLRIMFGPKGDMSLAIQFRTLLASHIYEKIKIVPQHKVVMPPEYVVAYMTSANFGIFMHWIESRLSQTPTQMAKMMIRIMNYGPLVSFGLRDAPPGSINDL